MNSIMVLLVYPNWVIDRRCISLVALSRGGGRLGAFVLDNAWPASFSVKEIEAWSNTLSDRQRIDSKS
ncbi:MAG: hypothetical protein R3C68_11320 [Myxococcota bacterium]